MRVAMRARRIVVVMRVIVGMMEVRDRLGVEVGRRGRGVDMDMDMGMGRRRVVAREVGVGVGR